MRVVIVGGYGVFGERTARLLVRDNHEVWIAGRDLAKADALARRIGAKAMQVDLRRDPQSLFAARPDAVIDAVGPFQTYGTDPYALPRLCIARRCHYLDLSDAVEFTSGISALDAAARRAGVAILSGASSVPGLTSVIVQDLATGFDAALDIDIAILPGNRAPRGISVIDSILSGVGRPARAMRGGQWRQVRGWTDRRRYTLEPGLARPAFFVDVPDVRLFPTLYGARSVMFRAGLELGVMNGAIRCLAGLRRIRDVDLPRPALKLLFWLSRALSPFGTDRGGMQISVTGEVEGAPRERRWTLVAEAGDGPFVPGVMCRAILQRIENLRPGARPCIAEVSRQEVEAAMSDLAITTRIKETSRPTLFQAALGGRWHELPAEVRTLHSVQDIESFSGRAEVIRGRSPLARLAAWVFGFPGAGADVPLTVTKTRTGSREIWQRNFDGRIFRSHCTASPHPYRYRERFGPFNFEQDLPVENGSLHLPVCRGWFLGIPLPRFLLPGSTSREFAKNGRFCFDVALSAPLGGGLIVRYRGSLAPDGAAPCPDLSASASGSLPFPEASDAALVEARSRVMRQGRDAGLPTCRGSAHHRAEIA